MYARNVKTLKYFIRLHITCGLFVKVIKLVYNYTYIIYMSFFTSRILHVKISFEALWFHQYSLNTFLCISLLT